MFLQAFYLCEAVSERWIVRCCIALFLSGIFFRSTVPWPNIWPAAWKASAAACKEHGKLGTRRWKRCFPISWNHLCHWHEASFRAQNPRPPFYSEIELVDSQMLHSSFSQWDLFQIYSSLAKYLACCLESQCSCLQRTWETWHSQVKEIIILLWYFMYIFFEIIWNWAVQNLGYWFIYKLGILKPI